MKISIEHHNDQFNVGLSSKEGQEAFLVIKGCRVVEGQKGRFVSFPAKKLDSGKYWNHVYASPAFQSAVLDAYETSAPKVPSKREAAAKYRPSADDLDPPF